MSNMQKQAFYTTKEKECFSSFGCKLKVGKSYTQILAVIKCQVLKKELMKYVILIGRK